MTAGDDSNKVTSSCLQLEELALPSSQRIVFERKLVITFNLWFQQLNMKETVFYFADSSPKLTFLLSHVLSFLQVVPTDIANETPKPKQLVSFIFII